MSDITKCGNSVCPLRHTCWRFLAPIAQSGYQTWEVFEPQIVRLVAGDDDLITCSGYWAHLPPKEKNDGT